MGNIKLVLVVSLAGVLVGCIAAWMPSNSTTFMLLLLVLLFILIVLLWVAYKAATKTLDIFETGTIFILFYTLYSLSVPLQMLLSDRSVFDVDLATYGMLLCLVGLVFFLTGYQCKLGIALGRSLPQMPKHWNQKLVKLTARTYLFLGIALFVCSIATVGISNYLQAGYSGRSLLKIQTGPIELGLYLVQIGILLYCCYFMVRKRWPSLSVVIIYTLFILFIAYIGIRRPIFSLLLATIVAYHYLVKRVSFTKGLILAFIVGVPLLLFAWVRHIPTSQGFGSGLEFLMGNFTWSWLDLSATEFGAPFKNLLHILYLVPEQISYLYGSSYALAPAHMLPQALWSTRPPTLSQWYTVTFFPESFVSAGGNMGFFIVSEAYYNLGIAGVMILMCFWGVLLKTIYSYFQRSQENPVYVFLYSISLAWIVFLMRVDLAVALKSYFYTTFLPTIVAIVFMTGVLMKKPSINSTIRAAESERN